jgi:hypothetical protein
MDATSITRLRNLLRLLDHQALDSYSVIAGIQLPKRPDDAEAALAELIAECEDMSEPVERFMLICATGEYTGDIAVSMHETLDEARTHLAAESEEGAQPLDLLDLDELRHLSVRVEPSVRVEAGGIEQLPDAIDALVRTSAMAMRAMRIYVEDGEEAPVDECSYLMDRLAEALAPVAALPVTEVLRHRATHPALGLKTGHAAADK